MATSLARCGLLLHAILSAVGSDREALDPEDECAAQGGDVACGLSALQLRGRRIRGTVASASSAAARLTGWSIAKRCDGAEIHELGFVVRQPRFDALRAEVRERSDPKSPLFRKWLSRAEVRDFVQGEAAASQFVSALQAEPGVSVAHVTEEGEIVRARAAISTWEALLGTEFHVYTHVDESAEILRAADHTLPERWHSHVEAVIGASDFELPMRRRSQPSLLHVRKNKDGGFGWKSFAELEETVGHLTTPKTLQKMYRVPEPAERDSQAAQEQNKSWQVVFAALDQFWSPSDRTTFEAEFGIPQDNYVIQTSGLDIGKAKSGDKECRDDPTQCDEANLDVQYMMAVAPWAQINYWYETRTDSGSTGSFLNDLLDRYVHSDAAPHVISISYASTELAVTNATRSVFEVAAAKLAARGTTIVAASGDWGGASSAIAQARHLFKGDDACALTEDYGLSTEWPASSEFVTAVGGTMGAEIGKPDIVAQVNATHYGEFGEVDGSITSGGGFSTDVSRPSWQNGFHTNPGRGVPDVSLSAHQYAIVIGGRWISISGTSASAPVFAAMLSLINADLIARNRSTVGFVNPLLYKISADGVFNDVTIGDNRCAGVGAPCCGGYDASTGWDPVTGLGVPDFIRLRDAILASSP